MKNTVFISHSCNEDPVGLPAGHPRRSRLERARDVRAAIIEKIRHKFDPWLDEERIQPGDLWRLDIFLALYMCSAAVILLDEDAFDSPWVRQEATILNFRRRLNPSFVLIPVLLDEGSSDRFDQGDWKPLALRDLMALKRSPDQIADAVVDRLSDLAVSKVDPGLNHWIHTLAGYLRPMATNSPWLLNEACAQLGIAVEDWGADHASRILPFTQALLSAEPEVVAAVATLQIRPAVADQQTRRDMQRLLIPLWVNLAAAGSAAAVLNGSPVERRALLNTADENVADEYIDRAVNCRPGVIKVHSHRVIGEDPDAEKFFAQLEQNIISECLPLENNPSSDKFAAWLRKYPYRRPVVHIHPVFAPPQLADLLDRLALRFPGISMLILDGDAERMPDDIATLRAFVIEPPPDAEAVSNAEFYRNELTNFARG